jgi:hypothetical protein
LPSLIASALDQGLLLQLQYIGISSSSNLSKVYEGVG